MFKKIKEKSNSFGQKIAAFSDKHPAPFALILAFLVAFINECFNRHSLLKPFVFLFTEPLLFLCNVAIVMAFLSIMLLFKKRNYLMALVCILWLALGLTNFIVYFFRITPFNANDFVLIKSVFPILPRYLTWVGVIACSVFLLALLVGLIILYIRTKKVKVRYSYAAVSIILSLASTVIVIGTGYLIGKIPERFPNLPDAYRDNGFTFCFSVSIIDRGIDKPADYEKEIDEIVSDVLSSEDTDKTPPPDELPNIIFVQLESFYDMNLLEGFTFSEDPTPVFTELKETCTHGYLTVPSIGAGTANTEFEVLCGMSLKYFGAGEYPYETILQKTTNESICYNLKNHGYTAHAVHNYKATFYDRNNVYSQLGFDTFTPLEYMNGLEYNLLGWAGDMVLTDYVMASLASTEGPDLVYCVTVQGHGKYPTSPYEGENEHPIKITSYPDGANEHSYNYFVDQLRETDEFIGALIAGVKASGENTKIIFFGDHIPNIGFEEDWVPEDISLYETEYVIWSSDGKNTENENLTSYQLSAKVMEILGLNDGVMTHLHQKRKEMSPSEYDLNLHMLQYDILYGDCVAYDGELPFKATDIKLGVLDITLTGAYPFGNHSYVKGTNFTKWSAIYVNGSKKKTEYLDDNTLVLTDIRLEDGDKVKVIQMSDDGFFEIGQTNTFTYHEEK